MGIVQEYRCPSCRKTWKIFAGHGRVHCALSRVLLAFPADIQAKIREDIRQEQEPLFQFHYRPASCRQCQNIVAIPVLRFLENGHTYSTQCPECGGVPEILEEGAQTACPICQKEKLIFKETGHWD